HRLDTREVPIEPCDRDEADAVQERRERKQRAVGRRREAAHREVGEHVQAEHRAEQQVQVWWHLAVLAERDEYVAANGHRDCEQPEAEFGVAALPRERRHGPTAFGTVVAALRGRVVTVGFGRLLTVVVVGGAVVVAPWTNASAAGRESNDIFRATASRPN